MSDTGWKNPTSVDKVVSGDWYFPTYAYTEDGNFAFGELSEDSNDLRFAFSFNGGYNYTYVDGVQTLTETNTLYTQGDSSELWGMTLTPESFNDDSFVLRFRDRLDGYQNYAGFGFEIPTGSAINGVEVMIKGMVYPSNYEMRVDVTAVKVYYSTDTPPVVNTKYPLPAFAVS